MDYADLDMQQLTQLLDQAKVQVFVGQHGAFYGSLLASTDWIWNLEYPTAWTDGGTIWANPHWFIKQRPKTRAATVRHELEHIARMHPQRRGTRNHQLWNYACDYRINNDMEDEGIFFEGFKPYVDRQKFPADMCEEDIYEILCREEFIPEFGWGADGDMPDLPPAPPDKVLNKIVGARTHANVTKGYGTLPAALEELINQWLTPKVPWEQMLQDWLNEKAHSGRTWRRPNRRYQHIYLPAKYEELGQLQHITFFLDASGSMSQKEVLQLASEMRHVKEVYRPEKMSLVTFNTKITSELHWGADDDIDDLAVTGGGGTNLAPVREWIDEHKPTAAIIMSDLECPEMERPEHPCDLLWIVSNGKHISTTFGQRFDIRI